MSVDGVSRLSVTTSAQGTSFIVDRDADGQPDPDSFYDDANLTGAAGEVFLPVPAQGAEVAVSVVSHDDTHAGQTTAFAPGPRSATETDIHANASVRAFAPGA